MAHLNDADRGKAFFVGLMGDAPNSCSKSSICRKPVIAAVEGVATAAGCQLVAACDLAIAGDHARFALPGVNDRSLLLDAAGGGRPRRFAQARDGDGADRRRSTAPPRPSASGLVNRVVPAGAALAEAQKLAATSRRVPRRRWRSASAAFYRQIEQPLGEAYALASKAMVDNLAHPDAREGIGAFLEKREPRWEGA